MKKYLFLLILGVIMAIPFSKMQAQYFTPVWAGQDPYLPMNIIISSAQLDGINLQAGDKISVLDTDFVTGDLICVGASEVIVPGNAVIIVAGQRDPSNGDPNGFTPGNEIIWLIWDNSESKIISLIAPTYNPAFDDVYTPLGTAVATLASYSLNTWEGTANSDWHDGDNWSSGMVTDSLADVSIPYMATRSGEYPELAVAGACHNITIEAAAAGSASILGNDNLSVSGEAVVHTNLSTDQWHMVSPPVTGEIAETFYLGGDPKVFLMDFDEATEEYAYITDVNTELMSMQGYMLWVNSARQNFTYTGALNSGEFGSTGNLTRNTTGSNPGWNMVGNPYPSAIDWDAATGWTKTNVDNSVYIISNGTWASYVNGVSTNGGTNLISTGQGFFVRVADGFTSGTLKMTDDVRVNNNVTFFKSTESMSILKLAVNGTGRSDETVIYFDDAATEGFDGQLDAYKRFATNADYPQLYTIGEEVDYSINCLPVQASVPMGFTSELAEEFTISVVESESIEQVWLEDLFEGTYTNLMVDSYTFTNEEGADPERFIIHFTAVSVNEQEQNIVNVYSNQNRIYVRSNEAIESDVEVYNILGQKVAGKKMTGTAAYFDVDMTGYYIVKVMTDGRSISQKVFVK